jgi:hypothetical protein
MDSIDMGVHTSQANKMETQQIIETELISSVRKTKLHSNTLKYDISQPSVEMEVKIPNVQYLLAEEKTTLDDAGNMLHSQKVGLFSSFLAKPKSTDEVLLVSLNKIFDEYWRGSANYFCEYIKAEEHLIPINNNETKDTMILGTVFSMENLPNQKPEVKITRFDRGERRLSSQVCFDGFGNKRDREPLQDIQTKKVLKKNIDDLQKNSRSGGSIMNSDKVVDALKGLAMKRPEANRILAEEFTVTELSVLFVPMYVGIIKWKNKSKNVRINGCSGLLSLV